VVVVLLTVEECRASTGAQPVTVSRSRAARKRPAARAPAGAVVPGALGAAAWDSRRRPPVLRSPWSTPTCKPLRCSINAGHRTPASRSRLA